MTALGNSGSCQQFLTDVANVLETKAAKESVFGGAPAPLTQKSLTAIISGLLYRNNKDLSTGGGEEEEDDYDYEYDLNLDSAAAISGGLVDGSAADATDGGLWKAADSRRDPPLSPQEIVSKFRSNMLRHRADEAAASARAMIADPKRNSPVSAPDVVQSSASPRPRHAAYASVKTEEPYFVSCVVLVTSDSVTTFDAIGSPWTTGEYVSAGTAEGAIAACMKTVQGRYRALLRKSKSAPEAASKAIEQLLLNVFFKCLDRNCLSGGSVIMYSLNKGTGEVRQKIIRGRGDY